MKIRSNILVLVIVVFIITGCRSQTSADGNNSQSSITPKVSIHSGVEFGMSPEEIKSLEEEAGFGIETNEVKASVYIGVEDDNYLHINGKIASIDDSRIDYYFIDNKLNIAEYSFSKDGDEKEFVINQYNLIQQSLEENYGQPTGTPANLHSDSFEYCYNMEPDFISNDVRGIESVDSWFIPVEDGYIVIDHYINYYRFIGSFKKYGASDGFGYYHNLVYQKYSLDDARVVDALKAIEENTVQLQNDL